MNYVKEKVREEILKEKKKKTQKQEPIWKKIAKEGKKKKEKENKIEKRKREKKRIKESEKRKKRKYLKVRLYKWYERTSTIDKNWKESIKKSNEKI